MKTIKLILIIFVVILLTSSFLYTNKIGKGKVLSQDSKSYPVESEKSYWFLLHRNTNIEDLYRGEPGDKLKSKLIKQFSVKTGIPGKKPTPLPELLNREYWIVTQKHEVIDNPEISPYFLTLDIPYTDKEPFGPVDYLECDGQCNWEVPGSFGLHGVGGDENKLSAQDPGSSGCVRHKDEDITFLYQLLEPEVEEIRYYITND